MRGVAEIRKYRPIYGRDEGTDGQLCWGSEPFEVNRKFWSHNLQLSKISSFSLRGGKITVGKTQGGGKTLASCTKVAG